MAYNKTRKYYGIVNTKALNVRKEPNAKAALCETFGPLKKYEVVDICDVCDNGWYYIKTSEGKYGFCSNVYLTKRNSLSSAKAYAAVLWAREIIADNDFHYGQNKWAHHHGCFFCGTNSKTGAKVKDGAKYSEQLKTYCCNPFVTACYCHGAGSVKTGKDVSDIIDCKVASKRINLANDGNKALNNKDNFKKITKPKNIKDLQVGDILLSPSHASIYSGSGKIVEASGGDDGVKNSAKWNNSIREKTCSTSAWNAVTKIYRYIGE